MPKSTIQCINLAADISPTALILQDLVPTHKPVPAKIPLRMNHHEGRAWYAHLMASRRYLEYGSGGSTAVAAWRATHPTLSKFEAHTVESDAEFFANIASPHIENARRDGSLVIHLADLAPLTGWGRPANWTRRDSAARAKQAQSYVRAVPPSKCCFDAVLIDGRFRAAAALYTLLLAHAHTVFLLHDYWQPSYGGKVSHKELTRAGRQHYNATIGAWFEHSMRIGTLAVLRPKDRSVELAKSGSRAFWSALEVAEDDPS